MNKPRFRSTVFAAAAAAVLALPSSPRAEDIDLFVSAASVTTADNPNILFIIDNTANWSRNDQFWVGPNGEKPYKQGQSELAALRKIVSESNDKVNIGLALFHDTAPNGIYIRYHVRPMTSKNKTDLMELIGNASCADGTASNGTPKCLFKNFSSGEQVGVAAGDYSGAMFDAFKYFGGCTSPAYAQSDLCKTGADLSRTKFGPQRYSGPAALSSTSRYDVAAYTDASRNIYNPPPQTSCSRNFIVFVGNGFNGRSDAPASLLTGVEGNATQLAMPNFTTTSKTDTWIAGTNCGKGTDSAARKADCEATLTTAFKEATLADSYACINERVDAACSGANNRLFDVQATATYFDVQPTGTSSVPSSTDARMTDEWSRYLFTTDVSTQPGQQNVTTYTLDAFNAKQDANQTALLFSMAKYGGGRYFAVSNEAAIIRALRDIMAEIQSVNSVFASASLPINATNRSQNENQVFIGMFRPDATARPRWYGNLKRYQIAEFNKEFKLADASTPPQEAVSAATGFIQPCAVSFWTTDTTSYDTSTSPATDTSYWTFSTTTGHAGNCISAGTSFFSDLPDGPQVEKGATAEVVRLGNNPGSSPTYGVNRTMLTCSNNGSSVTCNIGSALHKLDTANVSQTAVGAVDATEHAKIVNFSRGFDVNDDNSRNGTTDVRPSVHGDVAHSRPLPVNYGGTTGVVLYYGANDGAFRAVSGDTGKELWAFVAPEHHKKLKRLLDNDPMISYPPLPIPGSTAKDYFFDGSAGLFHNKDSTKVWIFPSMRRGGRMLYAFDVTTPTSPRLMWRVGCTNASLADTASCTTGFAQMGQTWSTPGVALVKGFSTDPNTPLIVVGGGYDSCEDQDAAPNTACTASGYTRRGNRVYVINATTGALEKEFVTNASVPADITLVDRNFDGFVDHGYVTDTGGSIYRIDFVDPANPATVRVPADWTITEIARTTGAHRKFLFGPAALAASGKVYLSASTGDRERPLITNYPYLMPVVNRAYMLVDNFATTGLPVNLDDTASMENFTSGSTCSTPSPEASGKRGWFFDLNAGTGEQTVTSSAIFGGLVFFSTNRPDPSPTGVCSANLGKANGYAVNLLNASGAADTLSICGGARSQEFIGGGLPPSPVTGTVPVNGHPVTVMIGGVQRGGGISSPIGAQRVVPTINQRRGRVYWYTDGDQ